MLVHSIDMTRLIFSLVLILGLTKCEIRNKRADSTLELVHVIFRHGDRTPDREVIYRNDPYINETYYPFGYGQLTNEGKQKEYRIGKALRKRYERFLGDFTLDSVDSRCTDYNRTKMSLQLVLASLFPPRGKQVWEKGLDWQPVPFNYWPVDEDHVLGDPHKNCPVFQNQYLQYLNSSEGKSLYKNFTELLAFMEVQAGQPLYSKSFSELYFTLTTEKEFGFKTPEWADSVFPHIKHLAIMDYNTSTATDLQKRLSSGFLMKKIIDDTRVKAAGKAYRDTKVFLYSAHESNVASLLRFLGIFSSHIPPYGSYIAVEIHNIKGSRGVKVYYQDYSSENPRRYRIPKCGNFCNLNKFETLHRHLLPLSDQECFEKTTTI